MVRAKFKCILNEVNNPELSDAEKANKIVLQPVTSGSEENKSFFKWTPGGNIELKTINPEAAAAFVEGEEYYVDFTKAEVVATTEAAEA